MKYKVFVDTNILLSGIFFEGNESSILDLIELDLITSEDPRRRQVDSQVYGEGLFENA